MLSDNDLKAVCSVTELTKMLGLSRARFYQLQKMGVFPKPIYCTRTKRPFYPLDLQQKCIEIRKTGIGHNGRPVIFYARRKDKTAKDQQWSNPEFERFCQELTSILKQMGVRVTHSQVSKAVKVLHPKGLERYAVEGTIIRNLFSYFKEGL